MAEPQDGWCYDMRKVEIGKVYMVAYLAAGSGYILLGASNHGRFGWLTSNFQTVPGSVYAFREIGPPPPLPSGWEDER